MKKYLFALILCITTLCSFPLVAKAPLETLVQSCQEHAMTSEELKDFSAELSSLFEELLDQKKISVKGEDTSLRALFVGSQTIFEQVLLEGLQEGKIGEIEGIIHTPMPATPLCIKDHPNAVQSRAIIIEELLDAGSHIVVAYPKLGLEKRTAEERENFQKMLEKYPENLSNIPMSCEDFPEAMVGATYVFELDDALYAFMIRGTQASNLKENGEWILFLGDISEPEIASQLGKVLGFIAENQEREEVSKI